MKTKSIQLTVNIATADLERKRKQVQKFSDKGLHTKVSLTLTGRQRMFKDKAYDVLTLFIEGLTAKASPPSWNKTNTVLSSTVVPTK